ncbi:MAG: acetylglutamate kinase, partial [Lysobacterales bacterium]
RDKDDPDSLISTLTIAEIDNLITMNVIQGGMIPKVTACLKGLEAGVKKTHIIDARINHALLLEFFTSKGVGTQILKG